MRWGSGEQMILLENPQRGGKAGEPASESWRQKENTRWEKHHLTTQGIILWTHNTELPRARDYHCSEENDLAMTARTTRVDILPVKPEWAAGMAVSWSSDESSGCTHLQRLEVTQQREQGNTGRTQRFLWIEGPTSVTPPEAEGQGKTAIPSLHALTVGLPLVSGGHVD